jgi:YbbR domain-containing protein
MNKRILEMAAGRFFLNKERFFSKIIEKWPVKVLSLVLALIISVYYRMNTLETRFFTVPLHVETNEVLVATNLLTSAVRVSLRGESDGIQHILESDIEAYIDLGRYSNEGSYRIPVQIRKKGTALGVEPLEISVLPIEIPLVLERNISRIIREDQENDIQQITETGDIQ